MDDPISRKAAMDLFMSKPPDYYHSSYIVGEINSLPSVDAEPVKRGRWTERHHAYSDEEAPIEEWQSAKCSVCGKYHTTPYMYYFTDYHFCPHCGAKMVVKWDEP